MGGDPVVRSLAKKRRFRVCFRAEIYKLEAIVYRHSTVIHFFHLRENLDTQNVDES